jgi:hypothetical protein
VSRRATVSLAFTCYGVSFGLTNERSGAGGAELLFHGRRRLLQFVFAAVAKRYEVLNARVRKAPERGGYFLELRVTAPDLEGAGVLMLRLPGRLEAVPGLLAARELNA